MSAVSRGLISLHNVLCSALSLYLLESPSFLRPNSILLRALHRLPSVHSFGWTFGWFPPLALVNHAAASHAVPVGSGPCFPVSAPAVLFTTQLFCLTLCLTYLLVFVGGVVSFLEAPEENAPSPLAASRGHLHSLAHGCFLNGWNPSHASDLSSSFFLFILNRLGRGFCSGKDSCI